MTDIIEQADRKLFYSALNSSHVLALIIATTA